MYSLPKRLVLFLWTVNCRDDFDFTFRLGDLNNARELFFIASWMDFILSVTTSFLYSWYLAIPRASTTVSTMAHTLVFNTRSSGQSSSKGLPKSLSVSMRLCLLLETQLCSHAINPSSWCQNCVSFPSLSFSNCAIHLASSGPHTYHPASQSYWIFCQPNHSSFPFYSAFSCSCTWSSGIFENLLRLSDATHLFWNSSFRGAGSDVMVVTSCH